jgi:hypothetical protein
MIARLKVPIPEKMTLFVFIRVDSRVPRVKDLACATRQWPAGGVKNPRTHLNRFEVRAV